MAKFVLLTGLNGERLYYNVDRISLEEVDSYQYPGHYAYDGHIYHWTIVREAGQPDRIVQERAAEILSAK
jgi:mRNA deadenylase 3'-5' endonuclease subunit Ccr4